MSGVGVRRLRIEGCRILDPGTGFDGLGNVAVNNGHIESWGSLDRHAEARDLVIDGRGLVLTPGFIDLHAHLRFPGFPDKETIASGTAAAAAGGFTTVCAMANTSPVVDDVAVLREVLEKIRLTALVRVHQLAAVSVGLLGERLTDMEALAAAEAVAFSDDGKGVSNSSLMASALAKSEQLGSPISVHEEDRAIVGGGVANAGTIARSFNLAEWPCRGESAMIARDLDLQRANGGHLHVAHVSCVESITLVRDARRRGLNVTAEVTPHHLSLTDSLLLGDEDLGLQTADPQLKVNPPLRSREDLEALVAAVADGTIDAIATDHAPHAARDKAMPFAEAAFGFSGFELALPLLMNLVRSGKLDLPTVVERLTAGPARTFHLAGGTLEAGSPADICIFDPDEEWVATSEALVSRGKNTPWLNATLRGRVRYTIVGGEVVHSH